MKPSYRIGISGVALNNDNLGCLALGYSCIVMLERVAQNLGAQFEYVFVDAGYDEKRSAAGRDLMCDRIDVPAERVAVAGSLRSRSLKARVRHVAYNHRMASMLSGVDFLIDMTQGDSFSDIYGYDRIENHSQQKFFAINHGIPLVLGPQTYGPFNMEESQSVAASIISSAGLVIARDARSERCARALCPDVDVTTTTDLAFMLPYQRGAAVVDGAGKLKVGLNVSGLLTKQAFERPCKWGELEADYDAYLERLIAWLIAQGYEVHLVPHVANDSKLSAILAERFPQVVVHPSCTNPVDAKSLIATMDVFLGSRMHACIAALSAGVPVVPLAYSRKFGGLFGSIGYKHTVDLAAFDTEEALELTKAELANLDFLVVDMAAARVRADELGARTCELVAEFVRELP